MGPRSGDRGNGDWSEPGQLFHMASMGPRSGDRGNNSTRPWSVIVYGRLQWGRDLVIAEIWEAGRLIRLDKALQWGRDLVIAEMDRHK